MTDQSCQSCGNPLYEAQRCAQCKAVIQKVCHDCDRFTYSEYHQECVLNKTTNVTTTEYVRKKLYAT
ncbi:hypothetical protein [Nitrosopumilus sp.]|uniref:hypothetical protein n=1 Tax=Nitrosopumilus sp. TaxID=2024843 RepID=UPI0029311BA9|nr:hypothetical protein [Nitrosopumilus sp.]